MNKLREQELLGIVKKNYQEIAADFDVTRNKVLWPTLVEFAERVKPGQSLLDVGCGNGRLLKLFAEKKVKYTGTDLSSNLITLAKKNSLDYSDSANFQVSNILDLESDVDGKFDWVYSIAVLHHLPGFENQLKALMALKSKLVDNGQLIVSVWRPWGNKKLIKELITTIWRKLIGKHPYEWNDLVFVWHNNKSKRYYHFFTRNELHRLIKSAGLEIVEFRAEERNYYIVLKQKNILN